MADHDGITRTHMTPEERDTWLAVQAPRHDLAAIIRDHVFRSSRTWPDGTRPTAPNWNPGCSCGESMYFFEWDLHLADVVLAWQADKKGDDRG